jgi:hypothetical protein
MKAKTSQMASWDVIRSPPKPYKANIQGVLPKGRNKTSKCKWDTQNLNIIRKADGRLMITSPSHLIAQNATSKTWIQIEVHDQK